MITSSQRLVQNPRSRPRLVECLAQDLRSDLLRYESELEHVFPEVMGRIRLSLKKFPKPFRFRSLSGLHRDAAFVASPQDGQIDFNLDPIVSICRSVIKKLPNRQLRRDIIRVLVDQFVLHEFFHVGQNFTNHGDAKIISQTLSPLPVAIMDLQADCFAAKCMAMLECLRADTVTKEHYHWRLLQQLVLMAEYWFPQVKSPNTKPHKRLRFLGLALTAARLQDVCGHGASSEGVEAEVPVDAPLLPLIDVLNGTIVILAFNPDLVVWLPSSKVDRVSVGRLVEGLDNRPAAESVKDARALLVNVGKLAAS